MSEWHWKLIQQLICQWQIRESIPADSIFTARAMKLRDFFKMWHRSSMLPMNSYPLHETCNTRYDVDPYCNWSLKFPLFRALVVKLLLVVLSQEVLMHHFPPGDPAEKRSMGWIRSREVSISIQGWTTQSFTYDVIRSHSSCSCRSLCGTYIRTWILDGFRVKGNQDPLLHKAVGVRRWCWVIFDVELIERGDFLEKIALTFF